MGKKKSVGGRKSVRIKKVVQKKAAPIYNSDDDVPDEEAENFHKDDIDTYNDECEYICVLSSSFIAVLQRLLSGGWLLGH